MLIYTHIHVQTHIYTHIHYIHTHTHMHVCAYVLHAKPTGLLLHCISYLTHNCLSCFFNVQNNGFHCDIFKQAYHTWSYSPSLLPCILPPSLRYPSFPRLGRAESGPNSSNNPGMATKVHLWSTEMRLGLNRSKSYAWAELSESSFQATSSLSGSL